jgi:hypothetical protein
LSKRYGYKVKKRGKWKLRKEEKRFEKKKKEKDLNHWRSPSDECEDDINKRKKKKEKRKE